METYEGLIETLEVLADTDAMVALKASRKDVEAGRLVSEEEVLDAL